MEKVIEIKKGNRTYHLRLSRAKMTSSRSSKEAVNIVRKIYPELEQGDKYYWKTHGVHHIDKNHFNNDPNNFAVGLRNDHWIYHRKKYEWEDKICLHCNREMVHLNNRCTVCRIRNKRKLNENPKSIRA